MTPCVASHWVSLRIVSNSAFRRSSPMPIFKPCSSASRSFKHVSDASLCDLVRRPTQDPFKSKRRWIGRSVWNRFDITTKYSCRVGRNARGRGERGGATAV